MGYYLTIDVFSDNSKFDENITSNVFEKNQPHTAREKEIIEKYGNFTDHRGKKLELLDYTENFFKNIREKLDSPSENIELEIGEFSVKWDEEFDAMLKLLAEFIKDGKIELEIHGEEGENVKYVICDGMIKEYERGDWILSGMEIIKDEEVDPKVYLAEIYEKKGIDALIERAENIAKSNPNLELELLHILREIVGDDYIITHAQSEIANFTPETNNEIYNYTKRTADV